jgi:hypothetical protein
VRPDHGQQPLQLALADAELCQVPQRADEIVEVGARAALSPMDQARLHGQRQLTGIVRVGALDDVGERQHLAMGTLDQLYGHMRLAVDPIDLLARAQIPGGLRRICRCTR